MTTKTRKPSPSTRKSTSAGPRRSSAKSTSTRSAAPATATGAVDKATPAVDASAKAAPAAQAPGVPKTAEATAPAVPSSAAPDDRLKRPDLIEAISDRVSMKRSEVKDIMDVMLEELGRALDKSDEVVVPPLGKLMVKKRMEKPGGDMLTVKLKRLKPSGAAGASAPLADRDGEG